MYNLKKYTLKDKFSFIVGIIQIFFAIIGYTFDSNYMLLLVLLISVITLTVSSIKKGA